MRKLSTFEQSIIEKMLSRDWKGNLFLTNLLDEYLVNVRILLKRKENTVEVLFQTFYESQKDIEVLEKRVNEINELIISSVNLINLLDKEGYIILFESAHQLDDDFSFGQGAINLPSVSYKLPDSRTAELLIKYATPQIICTSELQEFFKANFKTRDEIHHNQSLRLALIAIGVSIFATVLNLGFNINASLTKNEVIDCICPELQNIDSLLKVSVDLNLEIKRELVLKDSLQSLKTK